MRTYVKVIGELLKDEYVAVQGTNEYSDKKILLREEKLKDYRVYVNVEGYAIRLIKLDVETSEDVDQKCTYDLFAQSINMNDYLIVFEDERNVYYLLIELKSRSASGAIQQLRNGYCLCKLIHEVATSHKEKKVTTKKTPQYVGIIFRETTAKNAERKERLYLKPNESDELILDSFSVYTYERPYKSFPFPAFLTHFPKDKAQSV